VYNLNVFGVRTSHEQTWAHKTHHGPEMGKATTFPLIVYYLSPKLQFNPLKEGTKYTIKGKVVV
jgi:hypothetical protein